VECIVVVIAGSPSSLLDGLAGQGGGCQARQFHVNPVLADGDDCGMVKSLGTMATLVGQESWEINSGCSGASFIQRAERHRAYGQLHVQRLRHQQG